MASLQMIACSGELQALCDYADQLARVDIPVVIAGESGSGKELIARRLHESGPRSTGSFCALNCAALPASLIEAALFGHVRGAFTGAERSVIGLFQQASGGTLFLDEVAELALMTQASLLRVLETQSVRPLGAESERKVDVRIVAASNADLPALVARGLFRADLYYRLAGAQLQIPPLRARREDIVPLAKHFAALACTRWGRSVPRFAPDLDDVLLAYHWPGNARELRNVIESTIATLDRDVLSASDIRGRLGGRASAPTAPLSFRANELVKPLAPGEAIGSRLASYETWLIEQALGESNRNRTRTAAALGMPLRTLMRKIERFRIGKRREDLDEV
jgi:DNA-binding NtrC family response regulator